MDDNKRIRLHEIGYIVRRTCDTCIHADMHPHSDWGECTLHTYDHLKHTGPERQLSIYRSGYCSQWSENSGTMVELHQFTEFME